MGLVTEATITGLKPLTSYVYSVNASKGTIVSRTSNFMEVRTLEPSGVEQIEKTDNSRLYTIGNELFINTDKESEVMIYSLDGRLIATSSNHTNHCITIAIKGVYLVKLTNKTHKIII